MPPIPDLDEFVMHDGEDDCFACLARDIADHTFIPAVMAWEDAHNLPQCSLALYGAASLLEMVIAKGVSRQEVEKALSALLDETDGAREQVNILLDGRVEDSG